MRIDAMEARTFIAYSLRGAKYLFAMAATVLAAWPARGDEIRALAERAAVEWEQAARSRCNVLAGVTIDSVQEAGDSATVQATVIHADPVEAKHLQITLQRKDGQWLVANRMPAEIALAKELAADPKRWDAVVRGQPELIDRDLALSLADLSGGPAGLSAVAMLARVADYLSDPAVRAQAMISNANTAELQGDLARAKSLVEEALPLAERSGDAEVWMRGLLLRARLRERGANSYPQASQDYENALALADRVDNPLLVAFATGALGNLRMKQGRYDESLRYMQRAAALSKEIGDRAGVMKTETALGLIFQIAGDYELSLLHLRRAMELGANDPSNDAWLGQNLILMTEAYFVLGRKGEAMEAMQRAAELGQRSKSPIVIGESHRYSGSAHRRAREFAEAKRDLEEALTVFEGAKRIHFIPGALAELALTNIEAGDAKAALETAERCASYSRNVNEEIPFIECRTIAGEAQRALGDRDAALAAFQDAIDAIENLRQALIGNARQRTRFLERAISPYLDAADLLADRGDAAGALRMTERAKGRVLLDILNADASHAEMLAPREQQREAQLSEHLATLNRRLRDEKNEESAKKLAEEISTARAEYESYQVVLDAAHPHRKAATGSVPIATAADVAPLLGTSAAIIEYSLNGDHARAYVVTGGDHIETFVLPVTERDLEEQVQRFTEALATRDIDYKNAARALYAALLKPLETTLGGRRLLCIIPDGALWRLPFEALLDGKGRFVVESRACFYAPSMSVLAQMMRGPGTKAAAMTLLAVGNPTAAGKAVEKLRGSDLGPLREAESEVRALRTLYGAGRSRIYIGPEATKQRVKSAMENASVLHLATHAILDERNPLYSQVVLTESADATDDGLLSGWEIMHLDLHADIAVLSACETARGRVSAGEGIIGFTWAFFAAGCPSSVVSEWKVDSATTKTLMIEFHRRLLAAKEAPFAKAEALRGAKLALLKDARWRHPFYWSPFVLVGSPKKNI
jgi:CHAT domain-containing protein